MPHVSYSPDPSPFEVVDPAGDSRTSEGKAGRSSDRGARKSSSMKACMVAYTFYEVDNRVRRYAEALAKRGDRVDVIALRQEGQPRTEVIDGVRIFRIQRRVLDEKGKLTYLVRLCLFFLRSMYVLTREQMKERYEVIHVHSVPDFEVFAAIYPKLTGSKIILDIHDIVPEFYAGKFNVSQNSLVFRLLVAIERASAAFADHVIAANHIWQERLQKRSVPANKCTVALNYPDIGLYGQRARTRNDGKFILLYPGTLNHHQGVTVGIRAFALICAEVPEAEFHIYGSGSQLEALSQLVHELGLEGKVIIRNRIPSHEIASVIGEADLGIVPKRSDGFGNEAFSTKILEFMAASVPVIVPDTMIDKYYFNDSVVKFFHGNDERSLADAMLLMIRKPELRKELVMNANEFVRKYTWEEHQFSYLDLVDSLVRPQVEAHDLT
jgi:glycosyltransferase involved in cell wall biosynthesis